MDPSNASAAPIAIVGIAAELPSGPYSAENLDYDAFFDFLMNSGEAYEKMPLKRFDVDKYKGNKPGCILPENGTFLKDPTYFDHLEFGIATKDVRAMALSTRKLIEVAFLALLDSGIDYRGHEIGCYMAGIPLDTLALGNIDEYEAKGSFSGAPAMIANRVSYHMDLTGPSIPLDTACSSSATAMHLAVQAIRTGDCEAALVGGCQLNQRFVDFVQYSQGGVLSPDGKCKPFDAHADGFSRGEGAAVVVLKPLEDAIRDNDKIYATVRGTGINSTGSAASVSVPVAASQEGAMRKAYKQARLSPQDVDYVEAHATGTAVGDPVEANWIGKAFSRDGELPIGSVKGNIGHTEITAFLASVCKAVGIFKHKIIPPNVNVTSLNPAIKWDTYKLKVPLEPMPLGCRSNNGMSLISIASSGIGGSNAHCILQSPPHIEAPPAPQLQGPYLVTLGGLSPRTTAAMGEDVSKLVETHAEHLAQISNVYGRRVRQMTWRSYAVVDPQAPTVKPKFSEPVLVKKGRQAVGFVFSGQGPQHMQMGKQLFAKHSVFRESILEMDATYEAMVGKSLVRTYGLFDAAVSGEITLPETWPIEVILPAVAFVQIAIVDLLASFGIQPHFMIGHSAGETAALYASGAAPKSVAVRLAIARGQALALTEPNGGTMAALACDPVTANALIGLTSADQSGRLLEIACYNSQDAVTVAGHSDVVNELVKLCKGRGIAAQTLRTNVAVHSSMMDACEVEYKRLTAEAFSSCSADINLQPKIPVYSPVTEKVLDGPLDAAYFWRNTRQPVRFAGALTTAMKDHEGSCVTLIEIGAHPALSAYISSLCPENTPIICPMRRTRDPSPQHESTILLDCIGKFVTAGQNSVEFATINGTSDHSLPFQLPAYPFAKKHVPTMSKWTGQAQVLRGWNGPLNHSRLRMNSETHPDLAGHIIKGEPMVPATAFMEMILESGVAGLANVEFRSFLSLSHEDPIPVSIKTHGNQWSVESPDRIPDDPNESQTYRIHAQGQILPRGMIKLGAMSKIDIDAIRSRCQELNVQGFYGDIAHFAQYGPSYRMVTQLHRGEDEFLVEVDIGGRFKDPSERYTLDPVIMDCCCHSIVHPLINGNLDPKIYYLPHKVQRLLIHDVVSEKLTQKLYVHGKNGVWTLDSLTYDLLVVNDMGEPLCEYEQFTVAMHSDATKKSESYDLIYEPQVQIHLDDKVPCSFGEDTVVLRYIPDIDSLKGQVAALDFGKVRTLWFYDFEGRSAGAAVGFTRALRLELLGCKVRLAIFPAESEGFKPEGAIRALEQHELDDEIIVDATGQACVPRLRPLNPSPVAASVFNGDASGKSEHLKHSGDLAASVGDIHSPSSTLFHEGKVYILLGGTGSMGLRIAAWMYENGARHIVLTSRSGRKSLLNTNGTFFDTRALRHLESLEDLELQVVAADVSSTEHMRALVDGLTLPIGGCLLLAVTLEDKPFLKQTNESFARAYSTKPVAFDVIKEVMPLSELDFVVALTSISGIFGNAGQTNYSSANTALEFATKPYRNVFCLVTPMIHDSSSAFASPQERSARNHRVRHFAASGMSTLDLCHYLGDGIRKLARGPFWLYVPPLLWSTTNFMRNSRLVFEHLMEKTDLPAQSQSKGLSTEDNLRHYILKALHMEASDLSASVPLTAYGLDSLSASQLSISLKPFVQVTQLQLLADMTFNDIVERVQSTGDAKESTFDWDKIAQSGETVVQLCGGDGLPLFLLPGISGQIRAFDGIRKHFTSPLYGIQVTSSAPYNSLPDLASHYYKSIKAVQPNGPYRLASFCGSSLTLLLLLEKFNLAGDEVVQTSFVDHFPLFYSSPAVQLDEETVQNNGRISNALLDRSLDVVIEMYKKEDASLSELGDKLAEAHRGGQVSAKVQERYNNIKASITAHAQFLTQFADKSRPFDPVDVRTRFVEWMSQFTRPFTLYLADEGMQTFLPSESAEWVDMGLGLTKMRVNIIRVEGKHIASIADETVMTSLETDWPQTR